MFYLEEDKNLYLMGEVNEMGLHQLSGLKIMSQEVEDKITFYISSKNLPDLKQLDHNISAVLIYGNPREAVSYWIKKSSSINKYPVFFFENIEDCQDFIKDITLSIIGESIVDIDFADIVELLGSTAERIKCIKSLKPSEIQNPVLATSAYFCSHKNQNLIQFSDRIKQLQKQLRGIQVEELYINATLHKELEFERIFIYL